VKKAGIYSAILERIFDSKYQRGAERVGFERQDIVKCAQELGIRLPKNLGT
jgi:hypothetical protein